jgi:hypothetical protein
MLLKVEYLPRTTNYFLNFIPVFGLLDAEPPPNSTPYFPADSGSNPARTTLQWSLGFSPWLEYSMLPENKFIASAIGFQLLSLFGVLSDSLSL